MRRCLQAMRPTLLEGLTQGRSAKNLTSRSPFQEASMVHDRHSTDHLDGQDTGGRGDIDVGQGPSPGAKVEVVAIGQ